MAEKIGTEFIQREKEYLYYLGKDGYVWRSAMKRKTKKVQNEQ